VVLAAGSSPPGEFAALGFAGGLGVAQRVSHHGWTTWFWNPRGDSVALCLLRHHAADRIALSRVAFSSLRLRDIQVFGILRNFQHARLSGKAGLLLINILDEPEPLARNVHQGNDPGLKAGTNFLDRLGYLRPRLVRSNRISEIAFPSDAKTMGEFNELGKRSGGEFAASGWAILPESHRAADGVLLTYDDEQGDSIIFALAEVGYKRAEVSRHFN
jgi:hypothetical protein